MDWKMLYLRLEEEILRLDLKKVDLMRRQLKLMPLSVFYPNNSAQPGFRFGHTGQFTPGGFGGFGIPTNVYGSQGYTYAFGQQQPQQSTLFGNTFPASTTFGSQQAMPFSAPKTNGFSFGSQPAHQPSTNLFSSSAPLFPSSAPQPQQTSLFSPSATKPQTSVFGAPIATNNTFGALSSSFGRPQFNQQSDNYSTICNFGGSAEPQGSRQAQNTSLFGQPQSGTAVKFQAQIETETLMKGSTTQYVQTKQQCITFMKEYADKSIEELRVEDYKANRKGSQGFTIIQPTGISFGETIKHSPSGSIFNVFGSSNSSLGSAATVVKWLNNDGEDSNSNQPMVSSEQQ